MENSQKITEKTSIKVSKDQEDLNTLLNQSRMVLFKNDSIEINKIQIIPEIDSQCDNTVYQSTQLKWTLQTKPSGRYKAPKTSKIETRSSIMQTDLQEVTTNPYITKSDFYNQALEEKRYMPSQIIKQAKSKTNSQKQSVNTSAVKPKEEALEIQKKIDLIDYILNKEPVDTRVQTADPLYEGPNNRKLSPNSMFKTESILQKFEESQARTFYDLKNLGKKKDSVQIMNNQNIMAKRFYQQAIKTKTEIGRPKKIEDDIVILNLSQERKKNFTMSGKKSLQEYSTLKPQSRVVFQRPNTQLEQIKQKISQHLINKVPKRSLKLKTEIKGPSDTSQSYIRDDTSAFMNPILQNLGQKFNNSLTLKFNNLVKDPPKMGIVGKQFNYSKSVMMIRPSIQKTILLKNQSSQMNMTLCKNSQSRVSLSSNTWNVNTQTKILHSKSNKEIVRPLVVSRVSQSSDKQEYGIQETPIKNLMLEEQESSYNDPGDTRLHPISSQLLSNNISKTFDSVKKLGDRTRINKQKTDTLLVLPYGSPEYPVETPQDLDVLVRSTPKIKNVKPDQLPRSSSHLMAFKHEISKGQQELFQKSIYRRLRRQQHNLSPFDVYHVNTYAKRVDSQNFSLERNNHSTYLLNSQPKYISNKLRGGLNGEDSYGGAIVLTSDNWNKI